MISDTLQHLVAEQLWCATFVRTERSQLEMRSFFVWALSDTATTLSRRLSKRVASQPARLPAPSAGRDALTLLRTYPQVELFANTLSSLDDDSLVALSDPQAGRFEWLPLPRAPLGDPKPWAMWSGQDGAKKARNLVTRHLPQTGISLPRRRALCGGVALRRRGHVHGGGVCLT